MLSLPLVGARRFLFLGAHSDDIEIGCGGTILSLLGDLPQAEVLWVVFSAGGERIREAQRSARTFLPKSMKRELRVLDFRTSYFPSQAVQIKDHFETLKGFAPDIVFSHCRHDQHQDHKVLADLTWNTFRNHLILEYEIPKYEGDLGHPNTFVPLSEIIARKKARYLCRFFQTQGNKLWFSEDTFLALARLRGIECASSTGFAEGFHTRKLVVGCS